jgi:hypothetical protein
MKQPRSTRLELRRSLPTIAVAAAMLALSATGGASAALVITGKEIKDGTVTTRDVKDRTLTLKDLSPKAVRALDGGATGPAGPAGVPGPAGAPGISGYQVVTVSVGVAADSGGEVSGSCPTGKRVVGTASSFEESYDATQVDIATSGAGATAFGFNYDASAADVLVLDLVCASVG